MRFLDLSVEKPDTQTIRAAVELLEADYPIVFPADTCVAVLMRFHADNSARLSEVVRYALSPLPVAVSEDADWQALVSGLDAPKVDFAQKLWPGPDTIIFNRDAAEKISLRMPAHAPNRAYHTLVQLCDFPLLAADARVRTQADALSIYANLEYCFWDDVYAPQAGAPVWDATQTPPVQLSRESAGTGKAP